MGYEDLEAGDEVCQGHALVALPLLEQLGVINEDDEVLAIALVTLVVNLGLAGLASSHLCGCFWGEV